MDPLAKSLLHERIGQKPCFCMANMATQPSRTARGKLVVIYDELEKPLGSVTLKTNQGASAKGHNGLKSILASIGNVPFARIGVGIGRPASRESEDVARYVLRKMTAVEKERVEGAVDEVVRKLEQLETG